MDMKKRRGNSKGKNGVIDLHFVFSKQNIFIQQFLEEAEKSDRDMTSHFVRILKERYLPQELL